MTPENILIVEDDDDIRVSISDFLQMEGYSTVTARNGRDALDKLQTNPLPCLILLDLMMPIMNGQEFLKIKANDSSIAAIPVLIVSAVADESRIPRDLVRGFIRKPIDIDRLLELVRVFCVPASA